MTCGRRCTIHSRFSKTTGRCLDCKRAKEVRYRAKLRALGLARIQLVLLLDAKEKSPFFNWITSPRISHDQP